MSLAQHVTATEGVDREVADDDSLSRGLWRPLSYDPVAPTEGPSSQDLEPLPHIPAYKVPNTKRIAQVVFGTVLCCLASGIVFGFASLKPVLISEGVYGELCDAKGSGHADGDEVPCPEQDMRLNLFFISASIMTNASSLLAGYGLDRFGRRACYTASAFFLAAGCLLLGYAFAIPEFDGYVSGNVLLALGGTFLFVPSFELANAFPKYSGIIVATITGAFDASAAVFLFYRLAWEATGGAFAPNQFFFCYLIVPLILIVGEWTLMPRGAYYTTPELEHKIEKALDVTADVHSSDDEIDSPRELRRVRSSRADLRAARLDQIEEVIGDADHREERAIKEEERQLNSGVWGVLHGQPAHRQMMTAWFVLILLLTVLQMLRMNYFIATIRSQYRYLLQSEEAAEAINDFFDVALPVGGVIATPFIGLLLDNMSVATTLAILTGYIAVIGVLNCLPFVWAGYATVVAFVLFRPLYYSTISDYATKVFGFATFGRVYGTITCLSGLVNFSQAALDALTHGPLNGDPTPINIAMGVAGTAIGIALTVYVMIKGRNFRRALERDDPKGRDERIGLIREEQEEYGTMG
ncbi:Uu.00g070110.m01.CDS01 [Anthostomella pinea]|uniref:Uu.00g070110.m01.CDS01 n=1 Tax=Anthostomella pinea TaxID=933095 RepID=A0AAI8VUN6_9PEZI|nr:Uu.00g070110.m01.CDS01 [Anthostomella pinea]